MEAVTIRREFIKFRQPNGDDDDDDESNSNEGDNAIGESPVEGGDDAMELDETSEEPLEAAESIEPQAVEVRHSVITFAKVPSLPSVPVTVLQQNFGATDFLPTLKQYLREVSHLQPGFRYLRPTDHDRFSIFKKIGIHLTSVTEPGSLWTDFVRATPSKGPGILQSFRKDSYFDTVLVRQVTGMLVSPSERTMVAYLSPSRASTSCTCSFVFQDPFFYHP